jgi:hypothetical protein
MDHIAAPALPLTFDDEMDAPVGFTLTSRARREVVPEQLPALRLVHRDDGRADAVVATATDPTDVRPAQARALRRSGMPVPTIAAALGVGLDLVVGWTHDAEPVRRTARRSVQGRPAPASSAAPAGERGIATRRSVSARPVDAREARGMAVALAEFDAALTGVGFTHARPEVLGAILAEIRRQVPVVDWRVRVAIRVAEELGVDRCRGAVALALGVDEDRIVAGRWSQAPSRTSIEISLHVADGAAAKVVHDWSDTLAHPVGADRAAG